jgi:hypothetical protein
MLFAVLTAVYVVRNIREPSMNVLRVAALSASLIGMVAIVAPAHAQTPRMNMMPETPSKTPEQIEQEKERDKAYKESLKKIPDAKVSNDPWGGVRSNDAPKSAPAKAAAKAKTKTGGNSSN